MSGFEKCQAQTQRQDQMKTIFNHLVLISLLSLFFIARTQKQAPIIGVISTFAGNSASLGDNMIATSASLQPKYMAFDSLRNLLYFSEETARIRMLNLTSNVITTILGSAGISSLSTGDGGPASAATVTFINALTLDQAQNLLYLGEANTRIVREINMTTGIIRTVLSSSQLVSVVNSLVVDSQRNIVYLATDSLVYAWSRSNNTIKPIAFTGVPGMFAKNNIK